MKKPILFHTYVIIFETIYKNYRYKFFNQSKLAELLSFKPIDSKSTIEHYMCFMLNEKYLQNLTFMSNNYIKNARENKRLRLNREVKYKDIIELKKEVMLRRLAE